MLSLQVYSDSDSDSSEYNEIIDKTSVKERPNDSVQVDSQNVNKTLITHVMRKNSENLKLVRNEESPLDNAILTDHSEVDASHNRQFDIKLEAKSLTSVDEIENDKGKGASFNYFGLSDSDTSDNEDGKNKSCEKSKHEKVKHQVTSKNTHNVDIPASSFWKDITYNDVCEQKEVKGSTNSYHSYQRTFDCYNKNKRNTNSDGYNETQAGSYVPKRRRKDELTTPQNINHQKTEAISDSDNMKRPCFYVHHSVAPHLHTKSLNRIPKRESATINAHTGTVNKISWCVDEFSHLLLSGSMDRSVKIWNMFSSQNQCVKSFSNHEKAVKDVAWSSTGRQILSCSYDRTVRLTDVEKGNEIQCFPHTSFVTCIKYHPVNYNVFVSGANNSLLAWDQRMESTKPAKQYHYKDKFGQVQDVTFTLDGNTLLSCNDTVARDSADKSVMAWDFDRTVVLSNQIYQERYTCTRLKVHPHEPYFIAQTNGDYIAQFSTVRPYKMNKCKRFEGHKVSGYSVGCDFSPDGSLLASASADGNICIYNYQMAKLLKKINIGSKRICLDVAWHPVLCSTVASCSWDGKISLWQ